MEPAGRGPAKGLSLGSAASLRIEEHPHDYRLHGNREFVLGSSTTWIKLWVSWFDLQPFFAPANRAESWHQLNYGPLDLPDCPPFSTTPALRNLDRQIATANADGVRVILAVDEWTPAWATGAGPSALEPSLKNYLMRPTGSRPPADRSPDGPYAWFIEHLCARYQSGAPVNPVGPYEPTSRHRATGYDPRVGNPSGAVIDALEICNQPNVLWPQDGAPAAVAEMIITTCLLSALYGGPSILAPSLNDFRTMTRPSDWSFATPMREFAEGVLAGLRGFRPDVYLGWSQHNHGDVGAVDCEGVDTALELLRTDGIRNGFGQSIWLTECACPINDPRTMTVDDALEQERLQAAALVRNFEHVADIPEVRLWTHQTIHDLEKTRSRIGLRDVFDFKSKQPGPERLAWDCFYELPSAPMPEFGAPGIDALPAA